MSEELRSVRLLQWHKHAGEKYPPGRELPLPKRIAEWLVSQNVAEWTSTPARAALVRPPVRRCCGGR